MRIKLQELRKNTMSTPIRHASAFLHDFSDIFSQAPFSLLFCSFTGLLAGIGLSLMTGLLQALPGLMILIPPAIAMRGNIYSALVSRLGTSMHLGLFVPTLKRGGVVHRNAYSSLVLTLVLSVLLGFLAKLAANMFGMSGIEYLTLHGFILISVVAGFISGFILLGVALLISIIGYHRGWDLDNVSSPIITSAGDVITIPALFFAALLVVKLEASSNQNQWIWGSGLSPPTLMSVLVIAAAVICAIKGLKSNDVVVKRIIAESIPMLFICGIIDTLAGVTLDIQLERLIALPAILVILPPFLGESNALGGILSARLSSMLHIGTVKPKSLPDKLVSSNFAVIYILSVFIFLIVGITSYVASVYLGITTPNIFKIISISLLGGFLGTTFLNFASYYIAILSFRIGMDPDNDTIPLITCLTDVVGVFCLLFAMYILI